MSASSNRAPPPPDEKPIGFGAMRLYPRARRLLAADGDVRLGGRAFDVLLALVERAGEVVGKDELTARVWPRTIVEETNLRVHIHALRKALGDDGETARYIVNVPGRGYVFVAPLRNLPSWSWQLPRGTTHQAEGRLSPLASPGAPVHG
jgi:DNA-binding winged helix-turn-helix (wHTH) protein